MGDSDPQLPRVLVVDIKDLRPAFLRLLPSFRKETRSLPELRLTLKAEVKAMVKKYGPELGPLYFEQSKEWEKLIKKKSPNNGDDPNLLLVNCEANLSTLDVLSDKLGDSSVLPDGRDVESVGAIKKSL